MTVTAKRMKAWKSKLAPGKSYPIDEALGLVKEFAKAKFDESVDVAVNLGIDASKSDQQVRGSTVMPHGIGKSVRVAVFTSGKNQEAAKAAGADIVGLEDLAEQVKAGNINFDVVIASPDAMRVVGQLGQILGPRGLMPNPKVGTVSPDVANAVKNAKSGQVRYRVDKAGIVHCHDRQGRVRADGAAREPAGADRRPAEGEAGDVEGNLSETGHALLDHGSWSDRRPLDPGVSQERFDVGRRASRDASPVIVEDRRRAASSGKQPLIAKPAQMVTRIGYGPAQAGRQMLVTVERWVPQGSGIRGQLVNQQEVTHATEP